MFDRKKYKSFAKQQLKGRWGIPVLITAVVLLVDFLFEIPSFIKVFNSEQFWYIMNNPTGSIYEINTLADIFNSSSSVLVSLIQIVVAGIFEVAVINVYLRMSMTPEPVSFSLFLEGLNSWGKAALASLWKLLWTLLWSMLFFIPGVIKSLAYSQMMFIITENKSISVQKAMKISMLITKGHKGELFLMYLSFFGWGILATLTFGIGNLLLIPYVKMSMTNAYHAMLQEAIEKGDIHLEDLSE